jgi:hypothetical protein
MNNTDKLLRALIDALGFDINRELTLVRGNLANSLGRKQNQEYDFLGNGHYQEINRVNNYKVTKKESPLNELGSCVPMEIQSEAWGSIINYVESHSKDIECGTNDYGDLLPVWEFMNRNCK